MFTSALTDAGSSAPEDAYLHQIVGPYSSSETEALGSTVTALFYVDDWTGPAGPGPTSAGSMSLRLITPGLE